MRRVAEQEGVNYLSRENNIGFKAGNLRNGLEHTDGDFIVICDADTRVFPSILTDTLGYFRDPLVAWVQTPQWFYDLPAGKRLPYWLKGKLGQPGYVAGRALEKVMGPSPSATILLQRSQDVLRRDLAPPQLGQCRLLLRRGVASSARGYYAERVA